MKDFLIQLVRTDTQKSHCFSGQNSNSLPPPQTKQNLKLCYLYFFPHSFHKLNPHPCPKVFFLKNNYCFSQIKYLLLNLPIKQKFPCYGEFSNGCFVKRKGDSEVIEIVVVATKISVDFFSTDTFL